MTDKAKTETKPVPKLAPEDQRVEVRDKRGNIARPMKKHLKAWLDKGWTPVDSAPAG